MESDSIEHGKSVLAGVIRGPRDVLESVMLTLTEDHFPDAQQRQLWQYVTGHYDRTGAVLTRETLSATLRGAQSGEALFYEQYWDMLSKRSVEAHSVLSWRVSQLIDIYAERLTGEALARSMEILRRGVTENGDVIRGHVAARQAAVEALAVIDRATAPGREPEGDIRAEYSDLIADYQRRQELAVSGRHLVSTGIAALDKKLGGGWQNGELDLVAGYTSSGKTSFVIQCAWHAAVIQGRNVVILTSETLRPQIRIKLIARHSLMTKSAEYKRAYPGGLDSSLIKSGALDAVGYRYYTDTVAHLTGNPAHGVVWVAQIPKGSTVTAIEAHLSRLSQQFLADLVIVDYLQLLRAERKRQSRREEQVDIIQVAKEVAAGYAGGRGVPIISPWQMSREGFNRALARDNNGGYYTLTDLAETNEAGATSDAVLTLMVPEMPPDKRRTTVRARLAKNRDGDTSGVFELLADYATCTFVEEARAGQATDAPDDPLGGAFVM